MGSLDLTMGSDNLAGMSVRVFAFRKCIENDIHTRSDHGQSVTSSVCFSQTYRDGGHSQNAIINAPPANYFQRQGQRLMERLG